MTIPVEPLAPSGSARVLSLRIGPKMLPGVALLAILLIGLASSVYTLVYKHAELPSKDMSISAVANGETTAAIAHILQHANPLEESLVTVDRVAAYLATGDLGAEVRRGCDNWLFLTDELVLHPNRTTNAKDHVRMAGQVAAYLKSRSIGLIVVPVPDKSRVEAADLCGVDRPAAIASRLDDFAAGLRQEGIGVVDVLGAMKTAGGELYLRTDTHWADRGSKLGADAVAAALRQTGLALSQKADFQVSTAPEHEQVGDLIRLAGLDHVPYPLRPRGDFVAPAFIAQSAAANVGLLDETPAPELAVIGTSFSRTTNFVPFLSLALTAPVENEALAGGGITGSAIAYFAKPEFQKSPPRAIVWEIPERMIEEPVPVSDAQWVNGLGLQNRGK